MTICGGIFALVGACLAVGAFIVGIAATGLKAVPMPWAIVSYLAYWPYMILLQLLPENLLTSFFGTFPLLYVFGLPMLGWALIGIGLGKLTAPRKYSDLDHSEPN
jgi:hypothetical protein